MSVSIVEPVSRPVLLTPFFRYPVDCLEKPPAAHQGLNDTFTIVMIACALCAVLALLVGRDPAVEATRHSAAAGEAVEEKRPTLVAD